VPIDARMQISNCRGRIDEMTQRHTVCAARARHLMVMPLAAFAARNPSSSESVMNLMSSMTLRQVGRRCVAALVASVLAGCGGASSPAPQGEAATTSTKPVAAAPLAGKKLIEAGCLSCGDDTHTPRLLRQRISTLEASPFSGVMVRASVSMTVFSKSAYPESVFTRDRADLEAVASSKLTDNFLWMGTSPQEAGFDWFDDAHWAATAQNVRNFARLAKAGGFKGIALDPENYNKEFELWGYPWQVRKGQKTYREYQAQVRRRGAQFVKAIQEEYPGAQIFSLGLASWLALPIPRLDDPDQEAYMATDAGALWFYFIHGMLDALPSNVALHDGDEYAYYFRRAGAFDDSRNFIRNTGRDAVILDPVNVVTYDKQVKIGQAVYVDGLLNLGNWDKTIGYYLGSDDERRRMLEHNIYHALRTSDEYVWIYSEQMNYWTDFKPAALDDALQSAKGKFERGEALGFSVDAAVDAAYQKPGARQALIGPTWARE
jgi:hypothetical protein